MKILRKLSEEKGSITMTVVAAMLFIISAILLAYFSLSNQSNDQSKKTRQIADSYKVTNSDLVQKYKEVQDNLNEITTMSITKVKTLGNAMLAKGTNTEVTDELGNNFVVPSGFKVTDDANNVTQGMVVQDKEENEFVWIPVGNVKYIENGVQKTKTINLGRYEFENGFPVTNYTDTKFFEEDSNNRIRPNFNNLISKDINKFIQSTNNNSGFYIGRYEARTAEKRKSDNDELKQLTEKASDYIYNYINQPNSSTISKSMYESNENIESDLINSYAWDTAVIFFNSFGNEEYSIQNSKVSRGIDKGTNNLEDENYIDKICNVYDISSNNFEWTTETCDRTGYECTYRGGCATNLNYYSGSRIHGSVNIKAANFTFRPILYIK